MLGRAIAIPVKQAIKEEKQTNCQVLNSKLRFQLAFIRSDRKVLAQDTGGIKVLLTCTLQKSF